jgi:glycosyltransferase involved in cell wall biosynthesis
MNILLANWTWFPSGGDWTAIENINKIYETHGHKVIPFSMDDSRNYRTEYSKYFIEKIDYKLLNKDKNLINGIQVLLKSIYSLEAKNKLNGLLKNINIDVAHLNNIHNYLTPSILSTLKSHNIPIVWTLHDYIILCPENSFVSGGNVCEKCKGGKFINCTINRCKKGSTMASFIASMENYIHHKLNLFKYVDIFICPSEFLYTKFIEFGFQKEKLYLLNYCYDDSFLREFKIEEKPVREDYILYVGRLEKIKGVMTLLKAMQLLPEIKLYVIGTGDEEESSKKFIVENRMNNIVFLGFKNKLDVYNYTANCLFSVCPSEWYENFPFSVIETMLLSKPVIGSDIGGIPELVINEQTGYTFEPGNIKQLVEKILLLYNNKDKINELGNNAYLHVSKIVNSAIHYSKMELIFKKLINK